MADLPSREELFERAVAAAIATANTQISPQEIRRPGSDANLIAAMATLIGEEIVNRQARALAGLFEATAEGDALDRLIFDRKGLPREPAAPAAVTLELLRPTAGGGAGTVVGGPPGSGPPTPTRIQTNQGIRYFLTQPAIFGALDLGPIRVTAESELAGLANEVGDDQSWSFVDVPFDTTITIANPDVSAGAANEELDQAYRQRSRDFFPTVRRGTQGAIQFGLLSTPGIASVAVTEAIAPGTGFPACVVEAFILDALGQSNQTLSARGLLNLIEFRAFGIPVSAIPGTPQYINIEFTGTSFDTSIVLDTSTAAQQVRLAIIAALNNQISNQELLRSTILAAARSVAGFVVEDTDLIEPAATLIPASTDIVFRTREELISIS